MIVSSNSDDDKPEEIRSCANYRNGWCCDPTMRWQEGNVECGIWASKDCGTFKNMSKKEKKLFLRKKRREEKYRLKQERKAERSTVEKIENETTEIVFVEPKSKEEQRLNEITKEERKLKFEKEKKEKEAFELYKCSVIEMILIDNNEG